MLNVFKVSEYLWYTYACLSLVGLKIDENCCKQTPASLP